MHTFKYRPSYEDVMQDQLMMYHVVSQITSRRKVRELSFEEKLDAMFDNPWSVGKCLGALAFCSVIVFTLWIFGCAFIGWN